MFGDLFLVFVCARVCACVCVCVCVCVCARAVPSCMFLGFLYALEKKLSAIIVVILIDKKRC